MSCCRPASADEPERTCVLALERDLPGGEESPPDAPAELADAVTALRLATGAPVAAGPVVFERLDSHPFGVRPLIGIAATEPAGEPTRLDPWRGKLAADLLARLDETDDDTELGEALERWELSLFEDDPLRSERLREALAALLGGADGLWAAAMRAAVLARRSRPRARGARRRPSRARARRDRPSGHGRGAPARLRRGDPARGSRPADGRPRRRPPRPPGQAARIFLVSARIRHGRVTFRVPGSSDGRGPARAGPARADRGARA